MRLLPDNRLIALGTLAGAALTAGSLALGGIAYAVRLGEQTAASRTADADHESRLRTIEGSLGEMHGDMKAVKTDVSWIRTFLHDRQPAADADRRQAASTRHQPLTPDP
jgi:hypothetical protein